MDEDKKIEQDIDKDLKKLNSILSQLARYIESINLVDYISFVQSPKRVIFINLIGGISRGLGMALGMTLIFGLFLYILGKLIDLPLIGGYIAEIVRIVNENLKK